MTWRCSARSGGGGTGRPSQMQRRSRKIHGLPTAPRGDDEAIETGFFQQGNGGRGVKNIATSDNRYSRESGV